MVWRPVTGTPPSYQLVGTVSSTPMEVGPVSMPATVDVAVQPNDILGLYWPGTNPIPYTLPTDAAQVCRGGDIYQLTNAGIKTVGDIVNTGFRFTSLPCRVYSLYIELKDSPCEQNLCLALFHYQYLLCAVSICICTYRNSHYKDKKITRPSCKNVYFYIGNKAPLY